MEAFSRDRLELRFAVSTAKSEVFRMSLIYWSAIGE